MSKKTPHLIILVHFAHACRIIY